MASALMHMAVAKKVNDKLKCDERYFFLGPIAPDIGKELKIPRKITHFTDGTTDTPDLNKFYQKYHSELNNDYELGYFVHLIVDVLWFEEFLKNYKSDDSCILKNGEKINVSEEEYCKLIYNDYTNLNAKLLDYYDMDLSIFYEEYDFPKTKIEEIPYDHFRVLLDSMSLIVSNISKPKDYMLSLENIVHFIEYSSVYVLDKLEEYKII